MPIETIRGNSNRGKTSCFFPKNFILTLGLSGIAASPLALYLQNPTPVIARGIHKRSLNYSRLNSKRTRWRSHFHSDIKQLVVKSI